MASTENLSYSYLMLPSLESNLFHQVIWQEVSFIKSMKKLNIQNKNIDVSYQNCSGLAIQLVM